jgi:acyl-CoA reductase-like NAD-dependent aldehyde dehydrogenase
MAADRLKNYIDGAWTESTSSETLLVTNPVTAEVIAQVPLSTVEEVGRAVEAARLAFDNWRQTPPYARARCMFRLKNLMEERFEDLAGSSWRTMARSSTRPAARCAGASRMSRWPQACPL